MNWNLNIKEIDSVLLLQGAKRYKYLIKKMVDHEIVWSLWKESGWALAADITGREVVPIWPHEDFSSLCITGEWEGYQPRSIALDVWLCRWIPGINKDNRLIAVFPTPKDKGIILEPFQMETDLRQELKNYE